MDPATCQKWAAADGEGPFRRLDDLCLVGAARIACSLDSGRCPMGGDAGIVWPGTVWCDTRPCPRQDRVPALVALHSWGALRPRPEFLPAYQSGGRRDQTGTAG